MYGDSCNGKPKPGGCGEYKIEFDDSFRVGEYRILEKCEDGAWWYAISGKTYGTFEEAKKILGDYLEYKKSSD